MFKRSSMIAAAILIAVQLGGCIGLDFSPDGKQIVATTVKGLAVLNTDGSGIQLLPEGDKAWMPSWSPDGRHILYIKHENQDGDLMLYDTVTRKVRKIGSDYEPCYGWREDGKRFAAIHKTSKGQEAVWYDLIENGVNLKVPLGEVSAEGLNIIWLPNTDNIAFIAGHKDQGDVYTIEAGELKRITNTSDVIGLNLFANRKKLIWARRSPNTKYILCTLYAYDLDQRSVARLPFPERVNGLNAPPKAPPSKVNYVTVSPTGDRVAMLMEYNVGKKSVGGQEIKYIACCVVKLDGGEARQVYRTPAEENGGGLPYPVWSKDGNQLAVLEIEEKNLKIAVFRQDGTAGRRILDQKAE